MLMAHRTRNPVLIAHTTSIVVLADYLFTAVAFTVQPVTGILLAQTVGWPLNEPWIVISVILYVGVGLFWFPVIWIQKRMRDLATKAAQYGEPLPLYYDKLFRIWFVFGFPAFFMLIAIIWLMINRPTELLS